MIDSLIAVFLVIATGWGLKARGVLSPAHWMGVERLTYQVLFPAVVVYTLATADLGKLPVLAMGMSLVLSILIVAGLLLRCEAAAAADRHRWPGLHLDLPGLGALEHLCRAGAGGRAEWPRRRDADGDRVAAMIPLLNIMCVLVLARYASGQRMSAGATLRSIAAQPVHLVLGAWAGPQPAAVDDAALPLTTYVDIMGRAALGVGPAGGRRGAGSASSRQATPPAMGWRSR